ncbi:MAG: hypothetical protein RLZZ387_3384 [Chloroflexota bacterium]
MTEHERESGIVRRPEEAKEQRLDKTDSPGGGVYGQVPNLAARVVVGVFDEYRTAEQAVRALRGAGYSDESVSLVSPQPGQAPETSADGTQVNAGIATGMTAGAVAGAALVGLATLAIPGVGILLAAGPLGAAVGGAAVGGALGGLIGALNGLGIPTEEARQYEAAVRAGKSIVTVRAQDDDHVESTKQTLTGQGATVVHSYQDVL